MFMHKTVRSFFTLLFVTFSIGHAEVLFVPQSGTEIDANTHKKCQRNFHLSVFPFNAYDSHQTFSTEKLLGDNKTELSTLNLALQKSLVKARAVHIPTTVYELFALKYATAHSESFILEDFLDNRQPIDFVHTEYSESFKALHREVNNYILKEIAKMCPLTELAFEFDWVALLKAYHYRHHFYLPNVDIHGVEDKKEITNIHYLADITQQEELARREKKLLLWHTKKSKRAVEAEFNQSSGFASSLFSGFFYDNSEIAGTCAATKSDVLDITIEKEVKPSATKKELLYTLTIDRHEKKLIEDTLIFPPCSALQSMLQRGDFYHPRTKFLQSKPGISSARIQIIEPFEDEWCSCETSKCIHNKLYKIYASHAELDEYLDYQTRLQTNMCHVSYSSL